MENRYTIGKAAKLLGVTAETLRNWELHAGFPIPPRDRFTNRFYTETHLLKINAWRDAEPDPKPKPKSPPVELHP